MSRDHNFGLPPRAEVHLQCEGQASGKMRADLKVNMTKPNAEGPWEFATDEGPFHGGEATAPPPLAMFTAALTGCLMTQMRAFAKRLKVEVTDVRVETRVVWDWAAKGRTYETAPKSFEIDIFLESPAPFEDQAKVIATAKEGCFLEQTLGVANVINHRLRSENGWIKV